MKTKIKILKTVFMFFINSISVIGLSQDTIYKYDGTSVLAKVSEVREAEVAFHQFNNQDGPLYLENKSEIRMITYANGTNDYFKKNADEYYQSKEKNVINLNVKKGAQGNLNKIWTNKAGNRFKSNNITLNERDMHELMLEGNNPKLNLEVKKAKQFKSLQYVGFAAIPFGIAGVMSLTAANDNPDNREDILAVGSAFTILAIACPIFSITSKVNRNKANKEAVNIYNQQY